MRGPVEEVDHVVSENVDLGLSMIVQVVVHLLTIVWSCEAKEREEDLAVWWVDMLQRLGSIGTGMVEVLHQSSERLIAEVKVFGRRWVRSSRQPVVSDRLYFTSQSLADGFRVHSWRIVFESSPFIGKQVSGHSMPVSRGIFYKNGLAIEILIFFVL